MSIMPVFSLILNVSSRDRYTARLFLRSLINLIVTLGFDTRIRCRGSKRNRRRKGRLSMINVPDRSNVHVRFGTLKLNLSHVFLQIPLITNQFLLDTLRHFGVMVEKHRESSAALT